MRTICKRLLKNSAPEQLSLEWHFIGRIQSNKCKTIANAFSWVQTLDRSKVAQRLNQFRTVAEPLNVLIQVNLDDDPNKGGVDKQNAEHLLEQVLALPNLAPRGLMTILAKSTDSSGLPIRGTITRRLYEVRERPTSVDTLFVGMSADIEAAINAGRR